MQEENVRKAVRERYGAVARRKVSGCCGGDTCGPTNPPAGGTAAEKLGYGKDDLEGIPDGADMGLGCGNPQAIAALKPGEVVLDLGSGGGIDCFLAARQVGAKGRVIGVDMTPEMLSKARANAAKGEFRQVEFRLGEIEHLPVADHTVDVIISNCVINLSPDKPQVYREAFRVLKDGGRLAVSDVVATAALPPQVKKDLALYAGCIAGAASIEEVRSMLVSAGFVQIQIEPKDTSKEFIKDWAPGRKIEDYVVSANITGHRPRATDG
jgi:arsenite methyltransferase